MLILFVRFKRIECGSYYSYLPDGCKICRRGAKLVLFITGICKNSCFYCPISDERRGRDVMYANEREVRRIEDALEEANTMDAEGIAITGGEPILKLERVLEYLRVFRDIHSHLYTSIPLKERTIRRLADAGLDEIRFHPVELRDPHRFLEPIRISKIMGLEVGIEIPALKFSEDIVELVNGCDVFLNLNELEFSSTNYRELVKRGYRPDDHYGCLNSAEIADEYAKKVNKFHYCTARFKDRVQFRRRLIRMAKKMPEFYKITSEGTVLCGFIQGRIERIREILKKYNNQKFVEVDGGVETSVEFVEMWKDVLKREGFDVSVIERYPTSKRIVVEVIPL